MKVSTYLKGKDKFPDLGYPQRLRSFQQVVNPKPGYVAERPEQHPITEWKVTFEIEGEKYTYDVMGSYLDMVITRAARELPRGLVPFADVPVTITCVPKK